MKINFTKKEYRSLLEVIQIADWVLHAHDNEPRKDTQSIENVFQKILAHADEMDCGDLVELETESGEYYLSHDFESASDAEQFIQEFENNTFWEELISRLSERDVLKNAKATDLADIELKARFSALSDAEEKWSNEFSEFNLDRLYVDETTGKIIH